MSRGIVLTLLLLAVGAELCAGCSRRSSVGEDSPDAADTLGNGLPARVVPLLSPWTKMWRAAMPRFEVDSLTTVGRAPALRGYTQPVRGSYLAEPEGAATFEVLSALSPNSRYKLVFDWYQDISEYGGDIVIGGEPDSAPLLLDLRLGLSNQFETCGTPCGYHWGCWIDSTRFVLAGWTEVDAKGDTLRGTLSIYSLADSSETRYATRPVPRDVYERYSVAWHDWVRSRYLAWKADSAKA